MVPEQQGRQAMASVVCFCKQFGYTKITTNQYSTG